MLAVPRTLRSTAEAHPTLRKVLLGCGAVSSVLYIAADSIAALRYDGYSYLDQTVSELVAEGGETRDFMLATLGFPYNLLIVAFGAGVLLSGRPERRARWTGMMMFAYAATSFIGGVVTPMTPRGTEGALRNDLHGPMTAVQSLFIILSMACGAGLLGRRFRYYSYATIAVLLVFGLLASLQIPKIADNEPTPWVGLEERINIYATMLWFAALSGGLLLKQRASAPGRPGEFQAQPRERGASPA